MKLLLDANLSPTIRSGLEAAGHEVAHVGDAELLHASDREILDYAGERDLVIVTADSGQRLRIDAGAGGCRAAFGPPASWRRRAEAAVHLELLVQNLPAVAGDLDRGAVVSLSPTRLAVRRLPIR